MDNARRLKKVLAVMINGHEDIDAQSLWTLTNQDYPNLEIIVRCEKPKLKGKNTVEDLYLNCAANRESARKLALKSDADYFFFVDSDVVLTSPSEISKLMKQIQTISPAREMNPNTGKMMVIPKQNRTKHIIGGWYRTQNPHKWVAGKWVADKVFSNYSAPLPSLVETDMVGLGCALISREALKNLHFRPGIDKTAHNRPSCGCDKCKEIKDAMLGECLDFGNQAAKKKYKMYMDGDVVCGHVKFIERDGKRERIILT